MPSWKVLLPITLGSGGILSAGGIALANSLSKNKAHKNGSDWDDGKFEESGMKDFVKDSSDEEEKFAPKIFSYYIFKNSQPKEFSEKTEWSCSLWADKLELQENIDSKFCDSFAPLAWKNLMIDNESSILVIADEDKLEKALEMYNLNNVSNKGSKNNSFWEVWGTTTCLKESISSRISGDNKVMVTCSTRQ